MAEEITYIPYGLDEISQLDLMTSLANGVESYLGSKRWAKKDKYRNAWLQAYLNIINAGLTGASNESGVWKINHNGTAFPVDTMSNIDREMYLDAAYYIQLQMAKMTPRVKEEELKKEDLVPFKFLESFNKQFLNDYFGGSSELFADPNLGWNTFDARGENGLRPTTKRRLKMLLALQKYLDSLEDNKYNFEGTSFTDIEDARTKIKTAIDALGTPEEEDDIPAFNALGLKYRNYFSNGGNEDSGKTDKEGNPLTWNEWNKYKLQLVQDKVKVAKQNAYNNTIFLNRVTNSKMLGQNPQALKEKYKDSNSLLSALQGYAQKDIRTLTPDELSEILGAYRYLANQPIDNNLYNQIILSSSGLYRGAAPSRFKKINGIDNLIWDDLAKQIIQVNNRLQLLAILNLPTDLFTGVQTKQDLENVPRGGGVQLTDADKRDITATLLDLGAVVNPEVFTGTAMALGASGARTWNSIEEKGLWNTLTDWKTWADWGTGALGGVALLGDASSAVKAVRTFGKIMTIPAVVNALANVPEAKAAWDKIDLSNPIESAKKLTPQDYHALSSFLIGVVSGKNYVKGNLAERKVLQKSGFNTLAKTKRREYANKFGLARTKPNNQSLKTETSTLKLQKVGEDGKVIETKEIPINQEQKAALLSTKADKVNERAKELLGDQIPEGFKVLITPTNWRTKVKDVRSVIGKNNSEIFGKQLSQVAEETPRLDLFESWLSLRSKWNQYKPWSLGTNSNLRRVRNNIFGKDFDKSKLLSSASGEESPYARKPLELRKIKESNHIEGLPDKSNVKEISYNRAIMNRYRKVMEGKFSNKEMLGGKESIKIGNKDVRVYTTKDDKGNNSVFNVTVSGKSHNFKTQEEAKKFIADIVKQLKNNIASGKITKQNVKEIGKVLLDLKRKGWLKQGGQINSLDKLIEDFINNNNI